MKEMKNELPEKIPETPQETWTLLREYDWFASDRQILTELFFIQQKKYYNQIHIESEPQEFAETFDSEKLIQKGKPPVSKLEQEEVKSC